MDTSTSLRFSRLFALLFPVCVTLFAIESAPGCAEGSGIPDSADASRGGDDLKINPSSGIPIATSFNMPIAGFTSSNFGFCFGERSDLSCLAFSGGVCVEHGHHLGCDTRVSQTPKGTAVLAPADGIVRVTTDLMFSGYGADTKSNPSYHGCVLVLEHALPDGTFVTTLLGHLECEPYTAYSPKDGKGNPAFGTIVRQGQYVGHIGHYWHGSGTTTDWHHLHWGMHRGRFTFAKGSAFYVRGYAKKSEFTIDPVTSAWIHPEWMNPLSLVSDVVAPPLEIPDADAASDADAIMDADVVKEASVEAGPSPDAGETPSAGTDSGTSSLSDATASTPDASPVVDSGASDACAKIVELCNGLDDNCNGLVDEIFLCTLGDTKGPVCVTTCGTAGQRICEVPSCTWGKCGPFPENCSNTIDDDCNGLVDCTDPACFSSPECKPKSGGVDAGSSSDSGVSPDASSGSISVTLSYSGPVSPGSIWVEAWWQPSGTKPRAWGKILECVDTVPGDGKLLCTFSLPVGTSPFEFQVYLPDGRFWGDTSFDPKGGKGATVGSVTLTTPKGLLPIALVPNPSGAPYYNGSVATIP